MKLKRFIAVLAACLLVLSITACGSSNNNDNDNSSTTSSSEVLNVAIWDTNQEPGIQEILNDFTAETGIETKLQVIVWEEYWTMLEAGAQGGSMPDVFWMHSNEAERYMSNDMLLDVTDLVEASDEIDMSNYPDDISELYTYDDKNYAVPKDIDTIALWYNKTMFDEAGLDYPNEDWTWDDFVDAAIKLTKDDGSQYGTAIRPTNAQESYYNMIYGYGGEVITEDKTASGYDNEKTIEGMQIMQRLIDEGAMPSLEVMSESETYALFTSGKVAMMPQGSWMVAAFRDNEYTYENTDVTVLPSGPEGRVSIYNGLGWAASADGDNTEAAWQLIEYLGSKEVQEKQAELGVTMSAYKGTSDTWVNSVPQFNLQAYLDMTENMVIRPYSKSTVTWEDTANELFKNGWTGDETIEESCLKIAEEMNKTLAEE